MERQAKDGTFYQQVGKDEWTPVIRQAKDGTVYKKVGADDWAPIETAKPTGPSAGDKAWAAAEGMSESATLGALPYMKAGVAAATDWAANKFMGLPSDNMSFDDRVEEARAQGKADQAKAPGYAMAGQVAGFLAPGALVSKAVGKGLHAASKAPMLAGTAQAIQQSGRARELYKAAQIAKEAGNVKRAATLIKAARADLALQGARLGAEGAVIGGAYTPESGFSDFGARIEGAATGAATGAVMPAAFRGAGNIVRGTGNALASGAKKGLAVLGGVSEDVIDRYLKDPQRIRNASTFDELYEQVTDVVKRLSDDFDSAKVNYDTAKSHLDEVARGIKDSRVESKATALEEVQKARAALDEAFKARKAALADQASPTRIDPLVSDSLRNQKARVSEGSREAFGILDNVDESSRQRLKDAEAKLNDEYLQKLKDVRKGKYKTLTPEKVQAQFQGKLNEIYKGKEAVELSGIFNSLDNAQEALKIAGVSPATSHASTAAAEIESLRNKLSQLPLKLKFSDAKKLIQQIDQAEKVVYDSGAFTDDVSRAFQSVRRSVDEQLKTKVPEYAQKMAQVAEDTKLYSQASERFGQDQSRLTRLANIGRPTAKPDLEILKSLGAKEGGDLPRAIDEMVNAQRTLKSPLKLESLRGSLPENQAVRRAEMKAAVAKRMTKPREIQKAIERSGAFFRERSAKANMQTAKSLADKFKGFGEQSAESKLKQVAQGRKFATKTLQELSELEDVDFVEAVKAASDASAFTKTAFHGSRNVNFWTVLGALGSSVAGRGGAGAAGGFAFAGPVGMAFGAVTGAMMDVYGPQVTKKILDGVIKIKGPVTEKAIQAIDVPDNVKRELVTQFRSAILVGRAAANESGAALPKAAQNPPVPNELDTDSSTSANYQDRKPQSLKGPDKWSADGFDKLMKHDPSLKLDREKLMSDPKTRELLIQASDLRPGSKALEQIKARIKNRTGREQK